MLGLLCLCVQHNGLSECFLDWVLRGGVEIGWVERGKPTHTADSREVARELGVRHRAERHAHDDHVEENSRKEACHFCVVVDMAFFLSANNLLGSLNTNFICLVLHNLTTGGERGLKRRFVVTTVCPLDVGREAWVRGLPVFTLIKITESTNTTHPFIHLQDPFALFALFAPSFPFANPPIDPHQVGGGVAVGTEMLVYAKFFVLAEGATESGTAFVSAPVCLAFFVSAFRTMASASASLIGCLAGAPNMAGLKFGRPDTPPIAGGV